jgi:hypothetical protein
MALGSELIVNGFAKSVSYGYYRTYPRARPINLLF